jgi:transposase InsO family protein
MHHCLIADKKFEICAAVLSEALQLCGEFLGGPFPTLLNQHAVIHWRPTPHTPEQNGKMERFWRTLDNARHHQCNKELIDRIILHYNEIWHHRGVQVTPEAAR